MAYGEKDYFGGILVILITTVAASAAIVYGHSCNETPERLQREESIIHGDAERFAEVAHPGDIRQVTCVPTPTWTSDSRGRVRRLFYTCSANRRSTQEPFLFRCELERSLILPPDSFGCQLGGTQ